MELLFPKSEEASQAKTALDGYVQCHWFAQLSQKSQRELTWKGRFLHWAPSALKDEEIHFVTLVSKESIQTSA